MVDKLFKKIVAIVVTSSILATLFPALSYAKEYKSLEDSTIDASILEAESFYFGSVSPEINENANSIYLMKIGRGGAKKGSASTDLKILDVTSKYGKDYVIRLHDSDADVEVPELVVNLQEEEPETVTRPVAGEAMFEEESMKQKEETLQKSMEEINAEIQAITEPIIEEFKANLEREEGYQSLEVKSEVVHTTEDYFTLKLICFTAQGSGVEWYYYYTIDLNTGERLELEDLFAEGADYVTPISENVILQMREKMAEDDMNMYWLDDEIEELNFKAIKEDQSFYLDADGNVVISFNEGDVAPMYMGVVEFTIPNEVISDIRVY